MNDADAKAELKRITPPNAELLKLAERFPAPQEWYDEEQEELGLRGRQKRTPQYPERFYRGSMVEDGSAEASLPRPMWNRYG